MSDTTHPTTRPRSRRFWLTEALIVAGLLAFGGFALILDAGLSPTELLSSIAALSGR